MTGEIAYCYMIKWDTLYLNKLKSLGIENEVYERFKDDITVVVESIEPDTKSQCRDRDRDYKYQSCRYRDSSRL